MLCFPLTSSLNVLVLQVEVFNILFVTDNKKHSVYCQDCARKTSANLSGFIVLNQVRVDCFLSPHWSACQVSPERSTLTVKQVN